jgi:acetyl/propionyl-CoA carboxylase alpha subunit
MFASLLIANRGEIACRIIRTARRLGVRTIAVFSDADADAPHARFADEAVWIGASPARESYLDGARIIAAATASGAAAIHPGYGFLSENAAFAEAVIAAGLIWVGPPPTAITAMGLKDAAKRLMAEAGVPVTPGYLGEDQSPARLRREADAIGYPVLIKAVAGGGGKGMRAVAAPAEFDTALASCRREAAASFGDDRVLLETLVARPRHIEVQVFADARGNAVHLFERDCSLQRRHQKVIEEAPAPGMAPDVRAAVCAAALRAAQAVGYQGAGTVEFIADASEGLRADRIWFMEMNTRLQVEHPVTEMITGLDLVEWQLRVAAGEALPLSQEEIYIKGWAMEARLYAENPVAGFLPSVGPLIRFRPPASGVRVDSGVEEGGEVSAFYDPMIAKLVAHAPTREGAAAKLADACGRTEVWPVKTNAGFLARCLTEPDFAVGAIDTGFIEARLERLAQPPAPSPFALARAAWASLEARAPPMPDPSPWSPLGELTGFRAGAPTAREVWLGFGGSAVVASLDPAARTGGTLIDEGRIVVFEGGETLAFDITSRDLGEQGGAVGDGTILSPMPGRIVSVNVAVGAAVTQGQLLMTLEAMKMEHGLLAPFEGVVAAMDAEVGGQVREGVVLARIEPGGEG